MAKKAVKRVIRLGLIGLSGSGKTAFMGTIPEAFWQAKQVRMDAANDRTKEHFSVARRCLIEGSRFRPFTNVGEFERYRLHFSRDASLFTKAFDYELEIFDVNGEVFEDKPEEWYRRWLKYCHGFIFLVDGSGFTKSYAFSKQTRQVLTSLFKKLKDYIILPLSAEHKGKNHIWVSICATKSDLFPAGGLKNMGPEQALRENLFAVHEMFDKVRVLEKSWANIHWHNLSSIGYVWEKGGLRRETIQHPDYGEIPVTQWRPGTGNKEEVLADPLIIRPEGVDNLFLSLAKHYNRYPVPNIDMPKTKPTSTAPPAPKTTQKPDPPTSQDDLDKLRYLKGD